ncbi:TraM recognition domain-containing protein [Vibrio tapetis subsp. quintayensis]|uniref:type IV secretory system conjugative DNA transfer family protein n=1 Tax=Vibrio tapetis TaxID=52443 RepID=UPI0025B4C5CC|nr:DUF87 domain-containing protein [Vibrio tapetis]MDN3683213.1 TraM recognition domain-containing protein [Vibrio tapetis subsp. quintayensis]
MLDRIEYQLYLVALNMLAPLYMFTYYWGFFLSALSGLILPTIYFDRPEKHEQGTTLRRVFIALGMLLFTFGTISAWTVPELIKFTKDLAGVESQYVRYPDWHWISFLFFVGGMIAHTALRRAFIPAINQLKLKLTKKTEAAREERTDVRNVRDFLPDTVEYNPEDYFDLEKGVFVGLDANHAPQYIPLASLRKQHADILGTTGAGKGVASGLILYQLIMADEGVFVLDPKNDEWAPHLMRHACEQAGKPFYLIDLNKDFAQLDLLADTRPDQIEELLVAGFSFAEKGDIADFYRIDDRKAARKAPQLATDEERKTLAGIFESDYVQGLQDTVKAFFGKMEEMALVKSVNAPGGLNLNDIYNNGGCCYIIGSMRNSKILIAQKMILIRLFQLAEMRDRVNNTLRPIAIFLAELKYHISKPAMEGLGAARDKGVHMFLDHQSVADLRDCPADLNGDAVVGAVVENTKFKLVYKLQDPETAEWVAKMSGTILVDDETRYIETDGSLAETVDGKRNIRLAERHFVDTNMLLSLPPFVSYIFTESDVPKPSLISPIKVQKRDLVCFNQPIETPPEPDVELTETDSSFEEEVLDTNEPSFEEEEKITEPEEDLSFGIESQEDETNDETNDEIEDDNDDSLSFDTSVEDSEEEDEPEHSASPFDDLSDEQLAELQNSIEEDDK